MNQSINAAKKASGNVQEQVEDTLNEPLPTLSIDLKDYQTPFPELAPLAPFFDSYKQIYSFQRSKINSELSNVLHYLKKKVDRLDVTNVDILEEALQFKESL